MTRTHAGVALWPVCLAAGIGKHLSTQTNLKQWRLPPINPGRRKIRLYADRANRIPIFHNINEPADLDQAKRPVCAKPMSEPEDLSEADPAIDSW